jgi:hypothetical protein
MRPFLGNVSFVDLCLRLERDGLQEAGIRPPRLLGCSYYESCSSVKFTLCCDFLVFCALFRWNGLFKIDAYRYQKFCAGSKCQSASINLVNYEENTCLATREIRGTSASGLISAV